MDTMDLASSVTAVTGAAVALVGSCFRARVQRQRAREEARADHVRNLGPGSRVLDLGENGILIEFGAEASSIRGDRVDGA